MSDLVRQLGSLALGSRLRRLSDRLYKDIAEVYAQLDVPFEPRWFPVLYLLAEHDEMGVTEVASHIGLTHPAVNQIAGAMSAAGIVESTRDTGDQRRRLLKLTRNGRRLVETLRPVWDTIAVASSELLDSQSGNLLDVVDGIEAALDRESMFERVNRHAATSRP